MEAEQVLFLACFYNFYSFLIVPYMHLEVIAILVTQIQILTTNEIKLISLTPDQIFGMIFCLVS